MVFAFGVSLILVKVIDHAMGFTTDAQRRTEGLDRTEHGEVGFDLGLALESVPGSAGHEPRPASVPPNGEQRFTVVVEGADNGELMHAWSELCQAGTRRRRAGVQGRLSLHDHGAGQPLPLPRRRSGHVCAKACSCCSQ